MTDTVTFKGDESDEQIPMHSLEKPPFLRQGRE